jgi:cyanophycinase
MWPAVDKDFGKERRLAELAGTIALVGSGEYLPVMDETDRYLLEQVGGPGTAQVIVLPTAAGLEDPGSPASWVQKGMHHFQRLGAHTEPALILGAPDARDPRWVSLLETGDLYYFSGGNPQHVVETLAGSPAWEVIQRRLRAGAVFAGCSAGAMAIGGYIPNIRAVRRGGTPEWLPALALLPRLVLLPHFDQMARFVGAELFARTISEAPQGTTVVGVDEETALVRLAGPPDGETARPGASFWQVMGRQTVSVFDAIGNRRVYRVGEAVEL